MRIQPGPWWGSVSPGGRGPGNTTARSRPPRVALLARRGLDTARKGRAGRAGPAASAADSLTPPRWPGVMRPPFGSEGKAVGTMGTPEPPRLQECPAPAPRGPPPCERVGDKHFQKVQACLRCRRASQAGTRSPHRSFTLTGHSRAPRPCLPAQRLSPSGGVVSYLWERDYRFLTLNFRAEVSACTLKSVFFFQITPGGEGPEGCEVCSQKTLNLGAGGTRGRPFPKPPSPNVSYWFRPREPPRWARLQPDPLQPPPSWRLPGPLGRMAGTELRHGVTLC